MKTLIILALSVAVFSFGDWNPAAECIDGITSDITSFTFSDVEAGDYYATLCNGTLSTTSLWAAAKLYCSQHEIEAGEKLVAGWCVEYGSTTLVPYSQVELILTDEFIASLPIVNYEDIAAADTWNTSILISRDLYMAAYKTSHVWELEYQSHHRYGWASFGFWWGIVITGMVNRLINSILTARRRKPVSDEESPSFKTWKCSAIYQAASNVNAWLRKHLIIPSTFGTHHKQPFLLCTIPTRMETLVIVSFWIINIATCSATYELFFPNLYYTKAFQAWRYISDRTGIIAFYNLPWLWMFAGRNNIFIWLTGWSYQTFNIFHRHIARVIVVQAIVHSIGYSVIEANYNELAAEWKENYFYMGGIATISMSLLLVVSSMYFRQRWYEVFLLLHIALSVLVVVGLFYHVAIFEGEYNPFLWPLVAIWVFDRGMRIVRWVYCNLNVRLGKLIATTTAVASYDMDADLIRLTVVPGSDMLEPAAGQHYFLYHFRQVLGWENHPFTLASYGTATVPEVVAQAENKAAMVASKEISSSETSSQLETQTSASSRSMTFLIRPYTGWTRRLKNQCMRSSTGTFTFNMCIEGPYGHRSPIHAFENVLFIVGGTGVAGALPYLQEYLELLKIKKTVTRAIKFVWAAKQVRMLRSVADLELSPCFGQEEIEIQMHCTSEPGRAPESMGKDIGSEADSERSVIYGRPDVGSIILDFVEMVHGADSLGGRTAVLTCGPAAMSDDARAAVHVALKCGRKSVEYFEEAFG